jgi:uncharacterized membrane protein
MVGSAATMRVSSVISAAVERHVEIDAHEHALCPFTLMIFDTVLVAMILFRVEILLGKEKSRPHGQNSRRGG